MTALIGALRVSLSADTAQFEQGMRRAQSTASSAASGIQKTLGALKAGVAGFVGALSVGLFVNVIKNALEYAGSLAEVAQQLGVTTKDLQTFRFAAGQVGVSQEQLETGLSKLTITLGKVAAGAVAPTKALGAIGITVDQLKGKDTGEAFRIIADGLQKVTDRSQRAAVEVALFGKSGAQLDNLLSGGSAALNQLTAAAEKLGIVLSDEQIRHADDTADKLEALKTVLSANIAGVVADNAEAILALANALAHIVSSAVQAGRALANFYSFAGQAGAQFGQSHPELAKGIVGGVSALNPVLGNLLGHVLGGGTGQQKAAPKLPPAPGLPKGADIGDFLAPSGPKAKKPKADHSAENALRDQNQFDQELRRAQIDTLRAQQDLARNYVERATISIQILDAEKAAHDSEMQYQVALFALTKGKQGQSAAQAAQLQAEYDIQDSLEREKVLQDEQEQRQKDVQELTQHDFDRRRDVLESQAQIATTASERRKIELELLELAYEARRQALQSIIDTSKDEAAKEDARRDLLNLSHTFGAERQGVLNSTRGPLEDYLASLPDTAAKADEALQHLQVQGFQGLIDSAVALTEGFGAAKRSLLSTLAGIVQGILRMRLEAGFASMAKGGSFFSAFLGAASAVAGAAGGLGQSIYPVANGVDPLAPLPTFDRGGAFSILGRKGTDRNILSLNGLPIARVSHGERVNIANDNVNGGQRLHFDLRGAVMTQDLLRQMNQIGEVSTGRGAILGAAGAEQRSAQRARRSIP